MLTVNEGLSQNYIYCTFQDSKGFLWIGTKEGLNRYDGYSFKIYRSIPHDSTSLSNNNIQVIKEDTRGNLWIGTLGGGLNRFNRMEDNFTRFMNNPMNRNSLSDNFISEIFCVDATGVWIGTKKGHIDYYNCRSETFSHIYHQKFSIDQHGENEVNTLYQDSNGILWISSKLGGFDSYNIKSGKLEHIIDSEQLPESERINYTNHFIKHSAEIFWIARKSGLTKYNSRTKSKEHFETGNKEPLFYLVKSDKFIWLLSENDLFRFNTSTNSYDNVVKDIPETFTRMFCVDRSGILWLGTQGYGIIKIDPRDLRFNTEPGNFNSFLYSRIAEKFSKQHPDLFSFNERGMNFRSIIRDRKGNYWLSTHYWGLYKIDKDLRNIARFSTGAIDHKNKMKFIDKVFEDRSGGIWVTTAGGIDKFNEADQSFIHYKIYDEEPLNNFAVNTTGYQDITAVYQDDKNIFWLGTPDMGLVRFDPSDCSNKIFKYDASDKFSINNNFILTIAEDPASPNNVLWLGTEGGGLNCFDKVTGKFTSFTIANGLPNNVIYGIIPDRKGFLWMSTNKGISKFNPVNFTFKNYDVSDGLQSNEFNRNEYFKSYDGEIFFGGIYGFNHFYPEQIEDNKTEPLLTFTDFQLDRISVTHMQAGSPLSRPVCVTDKIILNRDQNTITFEFAAMEFSSPGKNQYAYKLEGLHEDWIHNRNTRTASFTNLDPGEYTFKVKGCNADGIWSRNTISVSLVILPAYWEMWWFRTLVLLLTLSAGYYIIRRKSEHIKLELSRKNEFSRKLIDSQENERKRIAIELHDSTGQNLLLIKNNLYSGLKHCREGNADYHKFEDALEVVNETIKEIKSVSQNLRPQQLDHLGLTTAIKAMIDKVSESSDIEFGYSSDNIDGMLCGENEIHFYRIVQEALNNILKHSYAAEAAVQIRKEKNTIKLLIRDNGKGFSVNGVQPHKGFGMNGMLERAGILKGKLEISSSEGNGTVIKLEINT